MASNSRRVLLVDDFVMNRRVLRKSLSELGLSNVIEASSGTEALPVLQQSFLGPEPVELLLLDLNMSGLSGEELLAELKTDPIFEPEELPLVILAEGAAPVNLDWPNWFCLKKPFSTAELQKALEQLGCLCG